MFRPLVPAVVTTLILTAALSAGQDPAKADAQRMERKLAAIVERGEQERAQKPSPLRTAFTDREVNAYFRINGPAFLPAGVGSPELTIDDGGKVNARAVVDLQKALKPSLFNPLSWFGGQTEITASGVVRTADGMGQLTLERATLAGVAIPKSLLQQVVSFYTKTPESPDGFNLDKPFTLPAKIHTVETARGHATVVQP
jgi:hypothetical protein